MRYGMSLAASLTVSVLLVLVSGQAKAQTVTTLYNFRNGYDGGAVEGSLTLSGSVLYGTTEAGGAYGEGNVFSFPVTGGSVTTLSSLNGAPNGYALSPGNLTQIGSTFYGTTYDGGANYDGSIFSVPITGGPVTTLLSFTGTGGACPGAGLWGNLTLVGSTLYGMTRSGGTNACGNVFSVNTDGSGYKDVLDFNGTNGKSPYGGLTLSGSTFYGMTYSGGAYGAGNVFSIPVDGGSPTTLYSFPLSNAANFPEGNLIVSGTTIYGTTNADGPSGGGYGSVFSMPVSGGTLTTLLNFNGTNGKNPPGYLTLIGSTLYGMTAMGGAANNGTLFGVSANGGASGVISLTASNGSMPKGGLTLSGSTLYGTGWNGGTNNSGAIFSVPLFSPSSTWSVDAGGNWSAAANWGNGMPAGMGAQAAFGPTITAPRSIAVDAAVGAGTLTFNSTNSYTLTGPQAITLQTSAGDAALSVLNGTHQISAALVLAGTTDVTVNNASDTLTLSGNISGSGMLLNKYGAGTLALAAANTFGGNTNVTAGTLNLAHPLAAQNATVDVNGGMLTFAAGNTNPVLGGLAGNSNVVLATAASQAVTLNVGGNGQNTVYSGSLSGAGSLTKQGTGALTLTAPSTYNGPTVISGGVLKLQAPTAGGSIGIHFIGNGSAFTGTGGVVAMSNWNNESGIGFSGIPLVNSSGQSSGTTFSLSGANAIWATGSANQLLSGYVYVTNYNSMKLTVSNIPYARYSIYTYVGDSSTGNQEVAGVNGTSYYYATEGSTPTTYTAITSTSPTNYQSGNYIEVDGLTSSSQAVTVAGGTQQFGGLCSVEIVNTASQAANNLLPAATALSIASGGTLDLGGGSQQVAALSDNSPGSGGSIVNSSTGGTSVLTVSSSAGSATFSGTIQGGGTLGTIGIVLSGYGTQVLAGSNSYTGGTAVQSGRLLVNGSLISPVTVASGGTLGGAGSLSSVTVSPGGAIAPGNPLGTLTLSGSLFLSAGSVLDYNVDTPTTSSMVSCGGLALNGQQFTDFNFTPTANFVPGVYDLIVAGSVPSGTLGSNTSGLIDGFSANIAVQGNDVVLTVVPEPSTLVLFGAGVLGLVGWVWRRRRVARTVKHAAFAQQDTPAALPFHSDSSSPNAARQAA